MNFINEVVGWIVGNRENISVWKCNQIPCKNGLRKPSSSLTIPDLKVKDLWNVEKKLNVLKVLFNKPIDVEHIGKIYIPKCYRKDKRIWPYSKNGQPTTKSACRVIYIRNESNPNPIVNWKALWRLPLPQRVLMFSWKCLENPIPVKAIIKSKNNSTDDKCPICEKEDSVGHALMLCDYARASWFGSQWGLHSYFWHPLELLDWWKNLYKHGHSDPLLVMISKKCGFFICGGLFGKLEMSSFIRVSR